MESAQGLTSEQRALVAGYWWQRAAGEMTSWVGWRHVLEDLRGEGSPEPVIHLAERAVGDEHRHAFWCRDWAVRFGHEGGEVLPRAERRLVFPGASESENRLLRIALCCLTETVGCFILQEVRPALDDPDLRRLNQRHLGDELQHSRAAWAHLWTLDAPRRGFLRGAMPDLIGLLPRACCEGTERDAEELVAFGYFTPRVLSTAHDEALRSVILPGLRHLGLVEAA